MAAEVDKALSDKQAQRTVVVVPEDHLTPIWVAYQVDRGAFKRAYLQDYIKAIAENRYPSDADEEQRLREDIAKWLTFHTVMNDRRGFDVMKRDLQALGKVRTVTLAGHRYVLIHSNMRGTVIMRRAQRYLPSGRPIDIGGLVTDGLDSYRERVPGTVRKGVNAGKYVASAGIRSQAGFVVTAVVIVPGRVAADAVYRDLFNRKVSREFLLSHLGTSALRLTVTKGMKQAAAYGLFRLSQECAASGISSQGRTVFAISTAAATMYAFDRANERWALQQRLGGWIETARNESVRSASRGAAGNAATFVKGHIGTAGRYVVDRVGGFV